MNATVSKNDKRKENNNLYLQRSKKRTGSEIFVEIPNNDVIVKIQLSHTFLPTNLSNALIYENEKNKVEIWQGYSWMAIRNPAMQSSVWSSKIHHKGASSAAVKNKKKTSRKRNKKMRNKTKRNDNKLLKHELWACSHSKV